MKLQITLSSDKPFTPHDAILALRIMLDAATNEHGISDNLIRDVNEGTFNNLYEDAKLTITTIAQVLEP